MKSTHEGIKMKIEFIGSVHDVRNDFTLECAMRQLY